MDIYRYSDLVVDCIAGAAGVGGGGEVKSIFSDQCYCVLVCK